MHFPNFSITEAKARVQFMLLTNIAIAQRIAVHLPEQALLRRHDSPIERRLVLPLRWLYSSRC